MGEGGTIGAPVAVVTAVNDALAGIGKDFDHIPIRPEHVVERLGLARAAAHIDEEKERQ
jgi:carbon-monoxide dehydrogenase large subunit